jgi:hypothetical protein
LILESFLQRKIYKAWIFRTVHEIPKLSQIMLVVRALQGTIEIDSVPERAILRNALFFSTCIFLSQGPIDFLPVGRHRYYVIIERILGWLLLALFPVTLGRIMIR